MSVVSGASFAGYTFDVTRLGKLDGLSTPSYSVSESVLAGVRGSRFNQALIRKRQITLNLLLWCESESEYFTQRAAILEACNKENGEDELTLTIGGTEYLINAVPEPPVITWPMGNYYEVQCQFTAYDPTIYSAIEESSSQVLAPSGGGFTFPIIFPITFTGSGRTGRITIHNNGNIPTYPEIDLAGLLTNPVIENETTGEFFSMTYTLAAGRTIEINNKAKQAILDGSTNLAQYIDDGAVWFTLAPGENVIRLSTDATTDSGYMVVRRRSTWGQL